MPSTTRPLALPSLPWAGCCLLAGWALGCGQSPSTTPAPATAATAHHATTGTPAELITRPLGGDIHWVSNDEDDVRAVFLEIDALPQPPGDAIGRIELHHAYRELRVIDEIAPPEKVVIVHRTELCEAWVTRARRIHTLLASDDDPDTAPSDPRTYLVLEFEGCEDGGAGISGVPMADIRVRSLRRDDLTQAATPALVDLVRPMDDGVWGGDPLPTGDFRMLELPEHGVTFVVGAGSWVVRDGAVLSGAEPVTLIEAGPLVLLELETPSEGWLGSLSDFHRRQ